MPQTKNKVKFNICNVHYAKITKDDNGNVTFATPVAIPGAVSISLDPTGEPESFYADGVEYYTINNNGHEKEIFRFPGTDKGKVFMQGVQPASRFLGEGREDP